MSMLLAPTRLVRAAPILMGHLALCVCVCTAHGYNQGVVAPDPLSALIALIGTLTGKIAVVNLLVSVTLCSLRLAQWLIFGKLRIIEWQRLCERLLNYIMGELVVLGAVVEADLAELVLWTAFSAAVGVLSVYAGLARDRLEYMGHLPELPSRWAYVRVVGLQGGILAGTLYLVCGGMTLLREAGLSMPLLFMFQAVYLSGETAHALVHSYFSRRERQHGPSDPVYYATLLPELGMNACQLLHHMHVWYVHGLSFSVVDVLLLANTKAAYEGLHRRFLTHRNFLRADANLQHRFRDAGPEELAALDDCCAICREPMTSAKVLPCGHTFHYTCLRSWLEQSDSCPTCRASLTAPTQRASRRRRARAAAPRPDAAAADGAASGAAAPGAAADGAAAAGAAAPSAAAVDGADPAGEASRPHPTIFDPRGDVAARARAELSRMSGMTPSELDATLEASLRDAGMPDPPPSTVGGAASSEAGAVPELGSTPGSTPQAAQAAQAAGSSSAEQTADGDAIAAEGEAWEEEGEEGEEGEESDDDDEVQSFLLFSSENWRWPSWLPRLHLELIRRRTRAAQTPDDTAAELARLREMFPNMSDVELRRVLLSSASLEAAVEQLLDNFER